jgi:ribosomal protein L23
MISDAIKSSCQKLIQKDSKIKMEVNRLGQMDKQKILLESTYNIQVEKILTMVIKKLQGGV